MYVAALRSMVESKRGNVEILKKVKACELVDYMVERAEEHPLAFCILLELRFAEVIFLLQKCEKQNRVELFIASAKFLLPLYASSHATKYVSMLCDFLIDWHCMSNAERIIFSKAVMTRKTKNGKTIFTDRFVEWMMRDMRMWCGKYATAHHHNLVQQVAATLNERKKLKMEGARNTKRGDHDSDDGLEINRVFCETLIFATETNIWKVGADVQQMEGSSNTTSQQRSNTAPTIDSSSSTRPSLAPKFESFNGIPLNTDILFCLSTGTNRAKEYFKRFLVDGEWSESTRSENESEGGVSLKKIDGTVAEDEKEFEIDVRRIEFLDVEAIKGAYIVDELKAELQKMNEELQALGKPPIERDTRVYKSWIKSAYATCVSNARLALLDVDSKWIEKKKNDILEGNDIRRKGKERLYKEKAQLELKNEFFALNNTDAYKKCSVGAKCFCFAISTPPSIHHSDEDNLLPPGSVARGRSRISMGGTNLLDELGSPF